MRAVAFHRDPDGRPLTVEVAAVELLNLLRPIVAILERTVRLLVDSMRYDVPEQDLRIVFSTMPARPRSGFAMANVRRAGPPR